MTMENGEVLLPRLRKELQWYESSPDFKGAPTWTLYDPARHRYFQIDWLTFKLLSHWTDVSVAALCKEVNQRFPLQIQWYDIEKVANFLVENELTQCLGDEDLHRFSLIKRLREQTAWQWLLHHYLFFRWPLFNPDAWLQRWLFLVKPLASRFFLWLTAMALIFGLWGLSREWSLFQSTMLDMVSWQGIVAYATTLILVKLLHELGHAFTAKALGCRVPTMGVAFLVMFPMAYTDVNDGWKLSSQYQRLLIGIAGIAVELTVAAWATLAWLILPDGDWRMAAFILATTTWITSILVNASPFLRFDGYFLLMDGFNIANLHARSFALGRWYLRKVLFGFDSRPPEYFSQARLRWIIAFAYLTWCYRLVLFVGIAWMVYQFFPKPFGQLLAIVELSWFILWPVAKELNVWRENMALILTNWRTVRPLFLVVSVVVVLWIPWDSHIDSQGVLQPVDTADVVLLRKSQLIEIAVQDGQEIQRGDPLFLFESPDVVAKRADLDAKAQGLLWQEVAAGVDEMLLKQRLLIIAEQQQLQSELQALDVERHRYVVRANMSGRFYLHDPDLHIGAWLADGEALGKVIDPTDWMVECYVSEDALYRIAKGDAALFYPDGAMDAKPLKLRVSRIDYNTIHYLSAGELAEVRGGMFPVRELGGRLIPEQALYRVA
ncbi:MAG: secretion protein HylD, partial [Zetaproteobacteria bacterium]|nr:secretion protein HylD [Zetaproteobacteria bacterium]